MSCFYKSKAKESTTAIELLSTNPHKLASVFWSPKREQESLHINRNNLAFDYGFTWSCLANIET